MREIGTPVGQIASQAAQRVHGGVATSAVMSIARDGPATNDHASSHADAGASRNAGHAIEQRPQ